MKTWILLGIGGTLLFVAKNVLVYETIRLLSICRRSTQMEVQRNGFGTLRTILTKRNTVAVLNDEQTHRWIKLEDYLK